MALAGAPGAAGAGILGAIVIGAIIIAQPRFAFREIEVPKITMRDTVVPNIVSRDVTVDHVVPKDIEIDIPRIVVRETSPAPRSPEERAFVGTEGWREAIVRGRILRPDKNGFVLETDQGEKGFYPATLGTDGKPEFKSLGRGCGHAIHRRSRILPQAANRDLRVRGPSRGPGGPHPASPDHRQARTAGMRRAHRK